MKTALAAHAMFPTDEQIAQRQEAFSLLKTVLMGTASHGDSATSDIPLIVVSVGSYAMGTWTSESDVDLSLYRYHQLLDILQTCTSTTDEG